MIELAKIKSLTKVFLEKRKNRWAAVENLRTHNLKKQIGKAERK